MSSSHTLSLYETLHPTSLPSPISGLLALGIHKVSHNSLEIFAEMERNASSPIPPATTTIPHVLIVPPSAQSESGYETLSEPTPRNDDPGYETVKPAAVNSTKSVKHRDSLSTSDYDPNYEVLRHNSNSSSSSGPKHNEGTYAKVWNPTGETNSDSEVSSSNRSSLDFHDYAKISDRSQRNFILGPSDQIAENDDEDPSMSDIYASISTVVERSIPSGNDMVLYLDALPEPDPNYSTISETRTGSSTTVPDGSGSSSTTAKTTPSTDSSLTPIDYSTMKNSTSTTTTITLDDERLTMYESLTGSESDPNYESVRYTDGVDGFPIRPENPYERLYSNQDAPIAMVDDPRLFKAVEITNNSASTSNSVSVELKSGVVEVGDYFQV